MGGYTNPVWAECFLRTRVLRRRSRYTDGNGHPEDGFDADTLQLLLTDWRDAGPRIVRLRWNVDAAAKDEGVRPGGNPGHLVRLRREPPLPEAANRTKTRLRETRR